MENQAKQAECEYICPKCDKRTEHFFLAEKGEYNEIYTVECMACGATHDTDRKSWINRCSFTMDLHKKASVEKFPKYDVYTGEVVHSREHRDMVQKQKGFHDYDKVMRDRERGNPHPLDRCYK
jgi:hypothetical protein